MPVGNAHDSVFAPTIGARSGMIMRKEIPSRAVRAVVFADSAPLPLGQIWSPALPMDFALACFFQTFFFSVHDHSLFCVLLRSAHGSATSKRLFCYKSSGPEMPVAWTRTSASPGTSCEMGASSYFRNSGPPRPWIRTTFMVEGMKVDCVIPLDSTLLAPVCTDTSMCKRRATGCVPDVL